MNANKIDVGIRGVNVHHSQNAVQSSLNDTLIVLSYRTSTEETNRTLICLREVRKSLQAKQADVMVGLVEIHIVIDGLNGIVRDHRRNQVLYTSTPPSQYIRFSVATERMENVLRINNWLLNAMRWFRRLSNP